jgi:hypothetical protein
LTFFATMSSKATILRKQGLLYAELPFPIPSNEERNLGSQVRSKLAQVLSGRLSKTARIRIRGDSEFFLLKSFSCHNLRNPHSGRVPLTPPSQKSTSDDTMSTSDDTILIHLGPKLAFSSSFLTHEAMESIRHIVQDLPRRFNNAAVPLQPLRTSRNRQIGLRIHPNAD